MSCARKLETRHQDVFKAYLKKATTPVAVSAVFQVHEPLVKGHVSFSFFTDSELVVLRVPFGFRFLSSITVDGEKIPWGRAVLEGAALRGLDRAEGLHEELACVVTLVVERIKRAVVEIARGAGFSFGFLEDSEWGCADGK